MAGRKTPSCSPSSLAKGMLSGPPDELTNLCRVILSNTTSEESINSSLSIQKRFSVRLLFNNRLVFE